MIAHYFYFLITVNESIFFSFYCIIAKWKGKQHEVHSDDKMIYRQNVYSSLANLLFPLCVWSITKYHYHFSLAIWIMAIITIPNEITYFINLKRAGKIQSMGSVLDTIYNNCSVLGPSDIILIHQWQSTLIIFNAVGVLLKVVLDLASLSLQDWRLTAGFFITVCLFIFSFCKNYLEEYVHLEKI